jgi:hypothetical protein
MPFPFPGKPGLGFPCAADATRSSLRRVTFIPTEKPPRTTRWDLAPDEWRLLLITFVGGLGSILV